MTCTKLASALRTGNFAGFRSLTANTTLTKSDMGYAFGVDSNIQVTLPARDAISPGDAITFVSSVSLFTVKTTDGTAVYLGVNNDEGQTANIRGSKTLIYRNAEVGWVADDYCMGNHTELGFQKFNNGLLMQWGFIQVNSAGPHTVTYPRPFSHIFNAQCCSGGANVPAGVGPSIGNQNPTQMSVYTGDYGPGRYVHWLLIGTGA